MKEIDTGTERCKCTLQDAARARHCRYCEPQITIDELNSELKSEQEDFYNVYEAIEEIVDKFKPKHRMMYRQEKLEAILKIANGVL